MSFEQFTPIKRKNRINRKNTYYIQAGERKTGYSYGRVHFSGGMRDNLKLTEYDYVELYTDRENKLIAIKPTNEQSDSTRAISKNGNSRFITCTSWLHTAVKELGYPERGSGSYKVIDGGLVVLEKPTEEVEL